jgi:predicted alpha/beta superfamily hydrolase
MINIRYVLAMVLFGALPWLSPAQSKIKLKEKPFVLGSVNELFSTSLGERRMLNIYLPEGYHLNDTVRYPVIYLLDGSADEDFVHVVGLVQFFNMMEMMPKSIVVGIANVDRKRDFTFPTTIKEDKEKYPTTGGSKRFISFIERELQPFIRKNYRANSTSSLIGQSLGGLLATEILFKKPSLFNTYIIVSPSLWWDRESLLDVSRNNNILPKTRVFVTVGKEGDMMENDAKTLVELLKRDNSLTTEFHYMPDEDHATILHHAVYDAFNYLY